MSEDESRETQTQKCHHEEKTDVLNPSPFDEGGGRGAVPEGREAGWARGGGRVVSVTSRVDTARGVQRRR